MGSVFVTGILILATSGLRAGEIASSKPTAKEISAYIIAKQSREGSESCAGGTPVEINELKYFSFTRDRSEQAIVRASTCDSGTGGPDVNSVFGYDDRGHLREWIPEEPSAEQLKTLFGNRNFKLSVRSEHLVAVYQDTSERRDPLVVNYRWTGDGFSIDSVVSAPQYKTSYDCAKAKLESERAICYVKPLAVLDAQLASTYAQVARTLTSNARKELAIEEKKWIRERDAACPIYKEWVDCLATFYRERIASLRHRLAK